MTHLLFSFIAILIFAAVCVGVVQYTITRRIRNGIRLILHWFDYIIMHPFNFDIFHVRLLGDLVDDYFEEKGIGKGTMYFAPRLKKYITNRFGMEEGESVDRAFARLALWESDRVRLDVYWTMIRGTLAEYAEQLEKGEDPDFICVSAPIAIIRKYWKV